MPTTHDNDSATTDERRRSKYRCTMQTRSGMYAQYDGFVEVWCDSEDWDDLFAAAVRELRRSAFPDYSADMWRMVAFTRVA